VNRLKRPSWGAVLVVFVGWVGTMAMAAACHALGFASPAPPQGYASAVQPGYVYTDYLQNCVNPGSAVVYCALAVVLGCFFRRPLSVAAGMMLPWPIACAIELIRDSTSHNLLPFEVLFRWVPALSLALMGAWAGCWIFRRFTDTPSIGLDLTRQK
jgi:hypothetical protein